MTAEDRIRVLVVGVSGVAIDHYLPFLAEQPDVSLVLYNRTPDKAIAAAERFSAEFADWDEAVKGVDCAFVLTTEVPRAMYIRRLIDAGVPRVFCEKPFTARDGLYVNAEDFAEGRQLLSEAAAKGVELAQQFNYRCTASVATALKLAKDKDLGPLETFTARSHTGCWAHVVDLVNLLTNGVRSVSASRGGVERTWDGKPVRDLAAILRGRNGAIGTVLVTAGTAWSYSLFEFELNFQRGMLRISDFGDPVVVLDYATEVSETVDFQRGLSRWEQYGLSFRTSVDNYLGTVRRYAPPPVPALAGVEELRLEAALRISADESRIVDLDVELPLEGATGLARTAPPAG